MDRLSQVLNLLEKEPDDAFLNHALAMEYLALGENGKAIAAMEHLLHKNPDHTGTYYHLGYAYLNGGEREKAIAIWEKGIAECKTLRKQHHLAELQSALNELIFEDD
ncbi:MAG: tetratricopeptide repeat protein [Bacteroidetes bacterium]|nr:MAG: tetratricopeptide repeat protein [Bacteroidota bacterium]